MVVVPHGRGVGGVEQNPRVESGDVAVAEELVVILAVPRRESNWIPALIVEIAAVHGGNAVSRVGNFGFLPEPGFGDGEHFAGDHYLGLGHPRLLSLRMARGVVNRPSEAQVRF